MQYLVRDSTYLEDRLADANSGIVDQHRCVSVRLANFLAQVLHRRNIRNVTSVEVHIGYCHQLVLFILHHRRSRYSLFESSGGKFDTSRTTTLAC
jgi:hypothetical protein